MIIFLKNTCYVLFETRRVPLHKDVFTKFRLNLLSGFGDGRFSKNHQCIVSNLSLAPLLKGCDPSFEFEMS